MGRSILAAILAAGVGLLAAQTGASAQTPLPYGTALPGSEEAPEAASARGATYIPGVGFRYVAPGSRVYGYRAYGYTPRAYRVRAYRRACGGPSWRWDGRCGRRWR
jgi:hypothetical protein